MIHSAFCDPGRKTTSRSFVAFERLNEVDSDPTDNRIKFLMQTRYEWTYDGRYK